MTKTIEFIAAACGEEASHLDNEKLVPFPIESAAMLREQVNATGSPYFSAESVAWFGERGLRTVSDAPSFTVSERTKAPSRDYRFGVVFWESNDGKPSDVPVCQHSTRNSAEACARETYLAWIDAGYIEEAK